MSAVSLQYPADWTDEKEAAFRAACEGEQTIHATNAADFIGYSKTFGWRDDRSPTGFLSGRVTKANHLALCVTVTDIMAATVERRRPYSKQRSGDSK